MRLQTLCELHELEQLRPVWKSWPGTRDSDPDFFFSVICSRRGCRPLVIALTREGKPDVIMIGVRELRKVHFRIGCFTLWQPQVNILHFVPGGVRGTTSADNCAALMREVARCLNTDGLDMAVWDQVDTRSFLYNSAVKIPSIPLLDHFPSEDDHWWMTDLPHNMETFLDARSRCQRRKLRQAYNRVLSHFEDRFEIRCFRSAAGLEGAIADMEEIAIKTRRRMVLGCGFMNTPETRAEMALTAEKGWLRVYILYFDGKPAAFWRGTAFGGCLQGDHVGFDPAWKKFSPGVFLFLNIVGSAAAEGIKVIDLGFGDTQLKHYFGNLKRVESCVCVYASTMRGMILNVVNFICFYFNHCARVILKRAGCLEWGRRVAQAYLARHYRRPTDLSAGCKSA